MLLVGTGRGGSAGWSRTRSAWKSPQLGFHFHDRPVAVTASCGITALRATDTPRRRLRPRGQRAVPGQGSRPELLHRRLGLARRATVCQLVSAETRLAPARSRGAHHEALHPSPPRPGHRLAPGARRHAGGHVRAGDQQGRFLRPGGASVSPASADGMGGVRRPAAAARLRLRATCERRPRPSPGRRRRCSHNASVRVRFWQSAAGQHAIISCATPMATSCCSCTQGAGRALLRFRASEFRRRRLHPAAARHDVARGEPRAARRARHRSDQRELSRCRTRASSARTPSSMPAMLDVPQIDEAFRAQQSDSAAVAGEGEAPRRDLDHHLSVQSARCGRLARRSHGGAHQREGHPAADEPPLSPAAFGAHHVRRQPLRGLHLRAAAVRDAIRARSRCRSSTTTTTTTRSSSITPAISSAATTSIRAWSRCIPAGFTHGPHPKALKNMLHAGEAGHGRSTP